MSSESRLNNPSWQANKWEFYKNAEGLWNWRTVAPEGWDHEKGDWSKNSSWKNKETSSTSVKGEWSHEGIDWVELARSQEGYKSKSDCEANARKHGWK